MNIYQCSKYSLFNLVFNSIYELCNKLCKICQNLNIKNYFNKNDCGKIIISKKLVNFFPENIFIEYIYII